MRWLKKWWLVVVVVLVALGIRVIRLSQVPASLYYDEIDLGYQARSLIETGKDYRGTWSPFFARSFNTDKTPLPIYWSIPGRWLWQDEALQVRMPTAVAGTLVVMLLMLLIKEWTGKKAAVVLVGLVAAFNPWMVQFSRIAFEAIYALMFYLLSLFFFHAWLKGRKIRDYYLAILCLSLGVYVYRIMSLYVPLTFALLGVIYSKEIWKVGVKHLVGGALLAGVIVLPFLHATTVASADQTRIEQVSIFSDPLIPIFVMRGREVDSGDYKQERLGQKPVLNSYFFHNKVGGWLGSLKSNYLKAFSTEFLLLSGDPNLRQGVGKMGVLLLADILGLLVGLGYVASKWKEKTFKWLGIWLLTTPLPADLTFDGATHSSRLILLAPPLLIITGLGWWRIVLGLKRLKGMRRWLLGGSLAGIWMLSLIFYLHRYFVHFPLESARWHGYGYEQTLKRIMEIEGGYKKVIMSNTYDPPMMYFLFWANIPPKEVQAYGTEFDREVIKNQRLDKFKVESWGKVTETVKDPKKLALALEDETLYMITQRDINSFLTNNQWPEGVEIVDKFYYPDHSEVAFYLVRKS